jgi:hypothetical protein
MAAIELDYAAISYEFPLYMAGRISNLQCYGYLPDSPVCPAWAMGPVDIDPNQTMRGRDQADFQSFVYLDRTGDPQQSQAQVSKYIKRTGEFSIRAALESMRHTEVNRSGYKGLFGDLTILRVQGWREYEFGDHRVYGARVDFRLIG